MVACWTANNRFLASEKQKGGWLVKCWHAGLPITSFPLASFHPGLNDFGSSIPVKVWANTLLIMDSSARLTMRLTVGSQWANTVRSQESNSLLPLHGELIGMISRIGHSKLTVWVILWVHYEITKCPDNEPTMSSNVSPRWVSRELKFFNRPCGAWVSELGFWDKLCPDRVQVRTGLYCSFFLGWFNIYSIIWNFFLLLSNIWYFFLLFSISTFEWWLAK